MSTPAILGAATLNYQLTAYAQGLWNDISDVIKLAERLAPTTPVPGAAGQFKKFEDIPEDDYRRHSPRFQGENFEKNLELVRRVNEIANEKGCTPSQLALAWVLAQEVVPIPGTKRRTYLEENAAALDVELTTDDLHRINEAFPSGAASGLRYSELMMARLNG